MPRVKLKGILSGIKVAAAMRRQVIRADHRRSMDYCITRMIKYKIGALLITDGDRPPLGVLSKTDVISAYYGMLPKETPVGDLLGGALVICYPDDMLADAVDAMHSHRIHQVFIQGPEPGDIIGTLDYMDVVGLMYTYCRRCRNSAARARTTPQGPGIRRLLVQEVMSNTVYACRETDRLGEVIEILTTHKCGAVLINDGRGKALGVISKTDLALAYRHGLAVGTPVGEVMHAPVVTVPAKGTLSAALQMMLLRDIQRLFVHDDHPDRVVGVLSLSDSARFRSGSCKGCQSSRLIAERSFI